MPGPEREDQRREQQQAQQLRPERRGHRDHSRTVQTASSTTITR